MDLEECWARAQYGKLKARDREGLGRRAMRCQDSSSRRVGANNTPAMMVRLDPFLGFVANGL